MEREEKENSLEALKNKLKTGLLEIEVQLLKASSELETVKTEIARKQIEIKELLQKLEQSYSDEKIKMEFIQVLPRLFEAIKIDNYAVLETGNSTSVPVLKLIQELFFTLKNSGMDLFGKQEDRVKSSGQKK